MKQRIKERAPGRNRKDPAGIGTRAVWAGENVESWEGATQVPVALSVSYGYDDLDEWADVAQGKTRGHIYGRNTNPTVAAFEEKVRILENAEAATSFASGMAAISNTLFTLLSPGDRVVSIKDTYGGTNKLFVEFLPRFGIEVCLCDTTDHRAIEDAIGEGCELLYLETRQIQPSKWSILPGLRPRATGGEHSLLSIIRSPRPSISSH